jgi:hypothetical protein
MVTRRVDGPLVRRTGTTAVELNPAVSAATQRATWKHVAERGRELTDAGKTAVIMIDHRLTGLDDRPIITKGLQALAQQEGITELLDVQAALQSGRLRSLPGYTAEASNHWRAQHPALVAKYPVLAGDDRLPINFMGYGIGEAKAAAGLVELASMWSKHTDGTGVIVLVGQGTGSQADVEQVYRTGGLGAHIDDGRVEVIFGGATVSTAADAAAERLAAAFNARHPNKPPIELDHDSTAKAGWMERLERTGNRVVAAFVDDRAHNLTAAQAASKSGERMIMIKSAAPGLSFSQIDQHQPLMTSTFDPNP